MLQRQLTNSIRKRLVSRSGNVSPEELEALLNEDEYEAFIHEGEE